jgi:hypothetical protein
VALFEQKLPLSSRVQWLFRIKRKLARGGSILLVIRKSPFRGGRNSLDNITKPFQVQVDTLHYTVGSCCPHLALGGRELGVVRMFREKTTAGCGRQPIHEQKAH